MLWIGGAKILGSNMASFFVCNFSFLTDQLLSLFWWFSWDCAVTVAIIFLCIQVMWSVAGKLVWQPIFFFNDSCQSGRSLARQTLDQKALKHDFMCFSCWLRFMSTKTRMWSSPKPRKCVTRKLKVTLFHFSNVIISQSSAFVQTAWTSTFEIVKDSGACCVCQLCHDTDLALICKGFVELFVCCNRDVAPTISQQTRECNQDANCSQQLSLPCCWFSQQLVFVQILKWRVFFGSTWISFSLTTCDTLSSHKNTHTTLAEFVWAQSDILWQQWRELCHIGRGWNCWDDPIEVCLHPHKMTLEDCLGQWALEALWRSWWTATINSNDAGQTLFCSREPYVLWAKANDVLLRRVLQYFNFRDRVLNCQRMTAMQY